MARLQLFLAAAAVAAIAAPAAAQTAPGRYLSWPGHTGGQTGNATLTQTGGAPAVRRPDRYSGGGAVPTYTPRTHAVPAPPPEVQAQAQQTFAAPGYAPATRTEVAPPPPYQPAPRPGWTQAPAPQPLPQAQPQQQAYSAPAPQPAAQPQPQQQQYAEAASQQQAPQQAAPTGDGVRYYSVHRGAGRRPDPIQQTYVSPQDAMVALAPASGQSLAERQQQSTAEENALDILRQLPPDQLAQLMDATQ